MREIVSAVFWDVCSMRTSTKKSWGGSLFSGCNRKRSWPGVGIGGVCEVMPVISISDKPFEGDTMQYAFVLPAGIRE